MRLHDFIFFLADLSLGSHIVNPKFLRPYGGNTFARYRFRWVNHESSYSLGGTCVITKLQQRLLHSLLRERNEAPRRGACITRDEQVDRTGGGGQLGSDQWVIQGSWTPCPVSPPRGLTVRWSSSCRGGSPPKTSALNPSPKTGAHGPRKKATGTRPDQYQETAESSAYHTLSLVNAPNSPFESA